MEQTPTERILSDPNLDPAIVDAAEKIVIRNRGPLTATTTNSATDKYWRAVATEVHRIQQRQIFEAYQATK